MLNATDGVFIHAEADTKLLDEFVIELSENPPAAAKVNEVLLREAPLENFTTFEIRFSDAGEVERTTLVSPDLATCADCVRELFDPEDRRYRYPFINCTNCGPRFTIIEKLPYDRKSTSMKDFPFCQRCGEEYADPLDRRFHAQPDACFECGPHISWREHQDGDITSPLSEVIQGSSQEQSDAILARAVELLLQGKIVAVKGIGGFHLVCDANNPHAIALLRRRKHREGKAFAIMAESSDKVSVICQLEESERALLESSQRPIVLLRKNPEFSVVAGLADDLFELGMMLPYTPIQHLLMRDFSEAWGKRVATGDLCCGQAGGDISVPLLVMTSGNLHDEPIVIDDQQAFIELFAIADAFLGHNRAIRARYDDSVLRIVRAGGAGDAVQFIRRARGYAPLPLMLPSSSSLPEKKESKLSIFATGPEQKNTFTLTRGIEAFVSQHIGDMENAETYGSWIQAKNRYEELFQIVPTKIVCDMHPEYLTSKWASEQSLPVYSIQHHHAHIASVMAENRWTGPTCGIAFDGTGYGMDGTIWGGEVLLCSLSGFERFANFAYVPMPGGAAVIKHPMRMAYGVLWAFGLLEHEGAIELLEALGLQACVCDQMIDKGINTPFTSSVGRLFDAASALLGRCINPSYESEPAILLEALAWQREDKNTSGPQSASSIFSHNGYSDTPKEAEKLLAQNLFDPRYEIAMIKNTASAVSTAEDTSVVLLDAAPTFAALLDDKVAGVPPELIAQRFHLAFVQAIAMVADSVRKLYGIETVALSGGVFMNRFVLENSLTLLERQGFTVAINRDLPPNDGCISFGQAVVAWAKDEKGRLS